MIFSNLQAWADAGLGDPDAQLALSEEALGLKPIQRVEADALS